MRPSEPGGTAAPPDDSRIPRDDPGRAKGSPAASWWRPWVVGAATITTAVVLFFGLGAAGVFDVSIVLGLLPKGVGPAETSLVLTTVSFAIGFFLALPLALVRAYGPGRLSVPLPRGAPRRSAREVLHRLWLYPAYGFASAYVAAVRGTPALVQVFIVYYIVIFSAPRLEFLGQPVAFWAGLLALTINTTGYQAEALRGGFQSVDRGQVEAARALGLSGFQTFLRVSLPQSLRLVTLPLANEWISNFKTSTVLSYITIVELYAWARTNIAYELGRPVEAFVVLAIFYLVINVTVSRTVTFIEHRRRIPGLGALVPEFVPRAG